MIFNGSVVFFFFFLVKLQNKDFNTFSRNVFYKLHLLFLFNYNNLLYLKKGYKQFFITISNAVSWSMHLVTIGHC